MATRVDVHPRSRRESWILLAAVAIVMGLAVWNTLHKSLWIDEAYSLYTASGTLGRTLHQAAYFELQPPLYFLLLNIWLRIGARSVEWMRALSVLSAVACVVFLWKAARMTRSARGVPAPILAGVTATVAWAAAEGRGYALALGLVAGTWYFFLALVTGRSSSPRRDAVLYAVLGYTAVLTSYYGGFVLLGQWVAALVLRRSRVALTLALACIGLALLPWAPMIVYQVTTHTNLNLSLSDETQRNVVPGGPVSAVVRTLVGSVFNGAPIAESPYGAHARGPIALALTLLLLPAARLVAWWRARPEAAAGRVHTAADTLERAATAWDLDEAAVLIAVAVGVVCVTALRATHIALVYPRHIAMLTPGVVLLWSVWTARAGRGPLGAVAAASVLAACIAALVSYERNVDVADSRGAARYVAAAGMQDEPVLVAGPESILPFRYYYDRVRPTARANLYGMPTDPSVEVYEPAHYELRDTAQLNARLRDAGVQHGFWLVVSRRFVWTNDRERDLLDAFVRDHATVRDRREFTNLSVVHGTLR